MRVLGDKLGAKALSSAGFSWPTSSYTLEHQNSAMLSIMDPNQLRRYRIIFACCDKFISIRRVINAIKLIIFLVDLSLQASALRVLVETSIMRKLVVAIPCAFDVLMSHASVERSRLHLHCTSTHVRNMLTPEICMRSRLVIQE